MVASRPLCAALHSALSLKPVEPPDSLGPIEARQYGLQPGTCASGSFRSISMASPSRLRSSTTLKVRKRRKSHNASDMKSTYQEALTPSSTVSGFASRFGDRFLPLCRILGFNAQYTPYPLVMPHQSGAPDQLEQLPEAPSRIALRQLQQHRDHFMVLT